MGAAANHRARKLAASQAMVLPYGSASQKLGGQLGQSVSLFEHEVNELREHVVTHLLEIEVAEG